MKDIGVMSLLKQFNNSTNPASIKECDATSAGDVAGSRGLLFNAPKSLIKRLTNDFTTDYNKKSKPKNSLLARFNSKIREGVEDTDAGFDQSEVISKLKGLETKEKTDTRDIATFGIEDDDGQVVRVSVRNDQASEFEKALQSAIADADADEDAKEIAEVLYKLKDHFDIVDVEWPEVQEDEEEGDEQFGDEQGAPGTDELSDLESTGDEGNDLGDMGDAGAEPASDGGDVGGLLSQVIDMMKADAAATVISEIVHKQIDISIKSQFLFVLKHIAYTFRNIIYGQDKDENNDYNIARVISNVRNHKPIIERVS